MPQGKIALISVCPAILILLAAAWFSPVDAATQAACQCTDYVYRQRDDISPPMGDAKDWIHSARSRGLPYDSRPQVGDAAVILNGEFGFSAGFGHVAVVIGVNRDHTRFDIAGWNGFKDDCRVEIYTGLPVTENTFFIHRSTPLYR